MATKLSVAKLPLAQHVTEVEADMLHIESNGASQQWRGFPCPGPGARSLGGPELRRAAWSSGGRPVSGGGVLGTPVHGMQDGASSSRGSAVTVQRALIGPPGPAYLRPSHPIDRPPAGHNKPLPPTFPWLPVGPARLPSCHSSITPPSDKAPSTHTTSLYARPNPSSLSHSPFTSLTTQT